MFIALKTSEDVVKMIEKSQWKRSLFSSFDWTPLQDFKIHTEALFFINSLNDCVKSRSFSNGFCILHDHVLCWKELAVSIDHF